MDVELRDVVKKPIGGPFVLLFVLDAPTSPSSSLDVRSTTLLDLDVSACLETRRETRKARTYENAISGAAKIHYRMLIKSSPFSR